MGSSGLFEDVRISIATAVAWFYQGERGFFRYWPIGRDNESIRHEKMWNTAVVGDNDFMHHLVERIGYRDEFSPKGMSINTELDHDGEVWKVIEQDEVMECLKDFKIRLSLSWKAKVFANRRIYEESK